MSEAVLEASRGVSFEPAPEWADFSFELPTMRPALEQVTDGRCAWLSDTQVNLLTPQRQWLSRTVYEVVSSDGLQGSGAINLDFDPSYHRLAVHWVRIVRDGVVSNVDMASGLTVLRREPDLERAKFDGHLTAHSTIPDLRVGDIVDVCHSLIGEHPLLASRFSAEWRLNWGCWVGETRIRLVSAKNRNFDLRTWNGAPECEVEAISETAVVRTWRTRSTEPATFEGGAPSWVRPFMSVGAFDPINWTEVAETFVDLYRPEPLSPELQAVVDEISAAVAEPAERAVRALRRVQSDLRYQSVTIGVGGFTPRPTAEIWRSRFGDCKDASRLLVALLSALGLEAEPVLVNTYRGEVLNNEAPALAVFDHCVTGLTLEGRRYWLDATQYPQGGTLAVLMQPRFGWCLPLRHGATLEYMGQDPLADCLDVEEEYHLPRLVESTGEVKIKTIYHGWRADAVRRRLSGDLAAFTRELIGVFERRYGGASALEPLKFDDDLEANRIELVERYEVMRLWQVHEAIATFDYVDDFLRPYLPPAPGDVRRWPISLGRPLRAHWISHFHLPVPVSVKEWDVVAEMPGVQASSHFFQNDAEGKFLKLVRSLTYERTVIEADEAPRLLKLGDEVLPKAAIGVRQQVRHGQISAPSVAKQSSDARTYIYWALFILWILGMLARLLGSAA